MICVYAPDCTDFSTNGYDPVSPSSCTVTEALNVEWELTLMHPLDEARKWQRSISELYAVVANIAVAQITIVHLQAAGIDWATITELNTAIANLVSANIQTADIDWAQIKDLTAGTAIIQKGVNGKLYVTDLAVTEANMATLTVGELIVKGLDGSFYAVSVDETGTVTT